MKCTVLIAFAKKTKIDKKSQKSYASTFVGYSLAQDTVCSRYCNYNRFFCPLESTQIYLMSRSWYPVAIAVTGSALFSLASVGLAHRIQPLVGLSLQPLSQPSLQQALSQHIALPLPITQATELANQSKLPLQASADTTDTDDAERSYQRAVELANQGVVAYQAAQAAFESDRDLSLSFTRRERFLWQATLAKLESIPPSADSYEQSTLKIDQYRGLLATTNRKLEAWDNAFLEPIIRSAGVPLDRVHLTLCQIGDQQISHRIEDSQTKDSDQEIPREVLERDRCRHHQGDQQMASPASLIKLPIAIALLDKTTRESIPLSQSIYVDPQNFTENAEGATVEVDREYTLAQLMTRMINESNNIATNQLIDYVGRESIAKTMANRGYQNTLVDHKLAGDRILPPNPGTRSNRATSDDITAMMAAVYGLENPGDKTILTALLTQRDREIGHQALAEMGPAIQWLGEKTGQNNRMIGTSVVLKVGPERYALTVAIDDSGNIEGLREIISGVADYLLEKGALTSDSY